MKIWLAMIRKSYLRAPCQGAWDEICFFLGNILEIAVLSDKDSSAQAPGLRGGLCASSCTLCKGVFSSSQSREAAPGVGLGFLSCLGLPDKEPELPSPGRKMSPGIWEHR